MGTEAYPSKTNLGEIKNSPEVTLAFKEAYEYLRWIGCESSQSFREGVLETPAFLFGIMHRVGKIIQDDESIPFYWPFEKVVIINGLIDWEEERIYVAKSFKSDPSEIYTNLRFLEETRIFLQICIDNKLGIYFN